MAKTRKKIQELADRMNFEMFVDGSKISLRAKFEFSDGYSGKTGADWDSAPEQTGTLLMRQS